MSAVGAGTARVVAEAKRVLAQDRRRGVSAWDGKRYNFVRPVAERLW